MIFHGTSLQGGKRRIHRPFSLRDAADVLLFSLLGAVLLKMFVLDAVHIPSRSMEGTLLEGDYILVNKLIYGGRTPRHLPFMKSDFSSFHVPPLRDVGRGDVIVFEFPGPATNADSPPVFVKRCVAVAGDAIAVQSGSLFVNDTQISTRAIVGDDKNYGRKFGPVTIPRAGDVLRLDAATEQLWEDVIRKDGHTLSVGPDEIRIDGTPSTRYTVEKDYLFVVGDNADHSYDSRSWGLLPRENVIGEAMAVYWSASPSAIRWDRMGTFVH